MNTSEFPRVLATRSKDGVTVVFKDKHWVKVGPDADKYFIAAKNYDLNKTQETLDALEHLLFPHRRYLVNGELSEGKNGEIYFKGTTVPIPSALRAQLFDFLDNGWPIESLKNFWYRAMLNPSKHGRDGFFQFCMDYGVVITNAGYAMLYKAVTTKTLIPTELDLAAVVGSEYLKLIRNGLDPAEYIVFSYEDEVFEAKGEYYEDDIIEMTTRYGVVGAGVSFGGTALGTVAEVFAKIPELAKSKPTTTYTDKYTRRMDIKLGVPVVKKRSECDPDINVSCSKGLHVGSYRYVKAFANQSDTVFACLVDPTHVVALPESDNSKIRVCEYLPYAIMERTLDGEWTELESNFFETDYEVHDAITLEARFNELVESLKNDMDFSLQDETANTIAVVQTRLQTLSHVDTSVTVDVTQDPNDPIEEEEDFGFLFDEEDNPILTDEEARFSTWCDLMRSGQTNRTYIEWVNYDEDEDNFI